MWLEPLTSSVSIYEEGAKLFCRLRRGFRYRFRLDCESPADIGHVDFLEMVYKQAEKPYIIVGLHFDQVSRV